MDSNEGALTSSATLEWLNQQGVVTRKLTYKSANLRVLRNELKHLYVQVSSEKSAPIRLQLKGISVHKNFMAEGKASIKFQEVRCTLYISNAPPASLLSFLKTIFFKMTGAKPNQPKNTSLRDQLLSHKPKQFDEISPVTSTDIIQAQKKVSKSTDTTPSPLSRKRKLTADDKERILKRCNTASPSLNEPLNLQQKEVLDACLSGVNVFFTGSAGTGKSYLLKKIIGALPPDVTTATASTGVAACHIGGITLHQFAGIGGGDASLERACEMASKAVNATNWRKCKHLIIDEVSMIDGKYFEKIEAVARHVRNNDKPFGGIQLILCGDFFQLPPVIREANKKPNDIKFCFQSKAWQTCVQRTFELTIVHRQSDPKFIEILNNIRIGKITEEISTTLLATSKQKIEQNGILATRLCSHTQDANIINESKLNALPADGKVFQAQDSDPYSSKQLDQHTPVPGRLTLKIGAQVMLLKNINISNGLVNGARGVVIEFREDLPVIRLRNNKEYVAKHEKWIIKSAGGHTMTRKQIPLKLAWAFSIHKSQGLTLDCVEMSLARVFEAGQAYVALSRAQSLETLRILDFKASQVWADQSVLGFYKKLKEDMEICRLFPLGQKHITKSNGLKKSKPISKKLFMDKPLVSIC